MTTATTVYHLKNCDTCKKAIKALIDSCTDVGHELNLIDVRADGVDTQTLQKFVEAVGFEVLLNTRSTTWRGLDDADKQDIDKNKAITLIATHPTLMKRPVIERDGEITVGWSKDVQAKFA